MIILSDSWAWTCSDTTRLQCSSVQRSSHWFCCHICICCSLQKKKMRWSAKSSFLHQGCNQTWLWCAVRHWAPSSHSHSCQMKQWSSWLLQSSFKSFSISSHQVLTVDSVTASTSNVTDMIAAAISSVQAQKTFCTAVSTWAEWQKISHRSDM